jgi:hypothetical protein
VSCGRRASWQVLRCISFYLRKFTLVPHELLTEISPSKLLATSAPTPSAAPVCVVFGAIAMDMTATAEGDWRTPLTRGGNATTVGRFRQSPGGKAANEAVALARLGLPVALCTRVGVDQVGRQLKANMQSEGVDTRAVRSAGDATGIALSGARERPTSSTLT